MHDPLYLFASSKFQIQIKLYLLTLTVSIPLSFLMHHESNPNRTRHRWFDHSDQSRSLENPGRSQIAASASKALVPDEMNTNINRHNEPWSSNRWLESFRNLKASTLNNKRQDHMYTRTKCWLRIGDGKYDLKRQKMHAITGFAGCRTQAQK
jgi:hypothetical protein